MVGFYVRPGSVSGGFYFVGNWLCFLTFLGGGLLLYLRLSLLGRSQAVRQRVLVPPFPRFES